jgi:gas vesicle protein
VDVADTSKANGWSEWAHRVLGDIERIDEKVEKIQKQINDMELAYAVDLAILKTKAAMIGGVWGAVIGAAVSILIALILHKVGV